MIHAKCKIVSHNIVKENSKKNSVPLSEVLSLDSLSESSIAGFLAGAKE